MKLHRNRSSITRVLFVAGGVICLALGLSHGQSRDGQGSTGRIEYSTLQRINSDDSAAVIAEKAAKVLPRPQQTEWMRLERTFFIHFGPNTFRGVEWGNGREEPSIFSPSQFDAEQWIRAVKSAGGKLVVLVSKHHDGLCLWPSRYTAHSVASSPWLGGKGNVVKAVADAARKYDVNLGVYLSPADLYQLRTNPTNPGGYYGDESAVVSSVIPTDPASFKTNPAAGRAPAPGFTAYTYSVDDYNRYFLNQLYELLTEYGPISEVWFDGANPDRQVKETYDYQAWYDLIHKLQPKAVIAVKGPDVRWVGNEQGIGRTTEWSVIPLSAPPEKFTWPDLTAQDLGSRAKLTPGSYLWWYPAEVNEPILNGWFWSANKRPKTASQLIDIFYQSVGRNGNMLMNLSPDTRGLIPENQLAPLREMAQVVDGTFAVNLAARAKLTADSSNPAHRPALAMDSNLDTWWEAASGATAATLTLTLPSQATFDVVSLQEAVDHRGQRIESFAVEVWNGSAWAQVDQQTTIGHKRLLRLKAPITTGQVRIRIASSRLEPALAEVGLFKQAAPIPAPGISERGATGAVTLAPNSGCTAVYTVDGAIPTAKSPGYRSSILLPRGGTVQAACLGPNGRIGMVASKYFAGLAPAGWKVVDGGSQEAGADGSAANAIDGSTATFWQTRNADASLPRRITVDMGRSQRVEGFVYIPRQDGEPSGVVERYRFETSIDGKSWATNIESGRFGNIRNNPVLQEAPFAPVTARFFRFTALGESGSDVSASAAEVSVLPAKSEARR